MRWKKLAEDKGKEPTTPFQLPRSACLPPVINLIWEQTLMRYGYTYTEIKKMTPSQLFLKAFILSRAKFIQPPQSL